MIKKSITAVILILTVALLLPFTTVLADVLIEPDDDFYHRNRNRMRSSNRGFYANGESGYIILLREPNSKREVAILENGKFINIMFVFDDDGTEWGVTEVNISETETRKFVTGWVRIDQLYMLYDSIMFIDEHSDELIDRPFSLSKLDIDGEVVMWSWPGSGRKSGTFNIQDFFGDEETNMNLGTTVYIDKYEREWGQLSYFYGYRDVWICISDPTNSNILAFNPAPVPDLYPAAEPGSKPVNSPDTGESVQTTPPLIIAIILVSIAVMSSLGLILAFWHKKATKK